MRTRVIGLLAALVVAAPTISAFFFLSGSDAERDLIDLAGVVDVSQSQTRGCCKNYGEYLRGLGLTVRSVEVEDLEGIKGDFGVPESMWSYHTVRIGGYFLEGHVPVEAIRKLLEEQPDIEGIALPGMPAGSPGMGGIKTEPFTIYSVSGEGISEFIKV